MNLLLLNFPDPHLGVVPVLVNTGVAALPAILAGIASVAALIFKPKALFRACRRNPGRALGVFAAIALIAGAVYWMFSRPPAAAGSAARGTPEARAQFTPTGDWASVAREIIRNRERAPAPAQTQASTQASPTEAGTDSMDDALIFRANNARTGTIANVSPRDLAAAWEYEPEPFSHILASPVYHNGRVYAASALVDVGSTYGMVFAVDAETGAELWQTADVPGDAQGDFKGFFSSPAITADGRYLLIGEGLHADANCRLVCLDTETGEVVWSITTPIHVESSPAIEGDIAVVGAGAIEMGADHKPQGPVDGVGNPGYVFAVRISTGEELWRHPVIDPESSPAIEDGIAYIGSGVNGNAVVALRIAPEEELEAAGLDRLVWQTETPHPAVGAVTLYDDLILVGCGTSNYVFSDPNPSGLVLALDRATGEERWRIETSDSVLGSIAVRDGRGVAAIRSASSGGRSRGQIIAFDLSAKGEIVWTHDFERPALALAGPAFTESTVYAVSNDGYLLLLDAATGEKIEEHYINDTERPGDSGLSFSSPFVAGNGVYVGSETGGLRALRGTATAQ